MIATAFVVAKAPVAGQAKTRLVPPLRPDQAAALQEALLLDTVASCEAGARELRVLVADDRDRPPLEALLPGIACDLQRGRGLAARCAWPSRTTSGRPGRDRVVRHARTAVRLAARRRWPRSTTARMWSSARRSTAGTG